ncbi:hypothetical protein AAKU67_002210 [Oxalobacteraceae bacterium GrIS 2.11]
MANPTDNTSTPTGNAPLSNTTGSNQQFVVQSAPWLARPSVKPWKTILADIPAGGQNIS